MPLVQLVLPALQVLPAQRESLSRLEPQVLQAPRSLQEQPVPQQWSVLVHLERLARQGSSRLA